MVDRATLSRRISASSTSKRILIIYTPLHDPRNQIQIINNSHIQSSKLHQKASGASRSRPKSQSLEQPPRTTSDLPNSDQQQPASTNNPKPGSPNARPYAATAPGRPPFAAQEEKIRYALHPDSLADRPKKNGYHLPISRQRLYVSWKHILRPMNWLLFRCCDNCSNWLPRSVASADGSDHPPDSSTG